MYLPRLFRNEDRDLALELMTRHSFATLMCVDGSELLVGHAPVIVDSEARQLRGHIARANPLAKALLRGRAKLTAEFKGPDAYVSPTWYEHRDREVPTWNYAIVHVTGVASVHTESELRTLLEDLSALHEHDIENPWTPHELDPEFFARLLQEIVGFSLDIATTETKLKLSQNRSPTDQTRVLDAHETRAPALAALMRRIGCGTPGLP